MDGDIRQWLETQTLGERVEVGGEFVYLTVRDGGAELGAYLFDGGYGLPQLENALRNGFRSAALFDAALGMGADGAALVLNQWLPDVTDWTGAAMPLEKLLNQLSMWREDLASSVATQADKTTFRTEQRLRRLFDGAKP